MREGKESPAAWDALDGVFEAMQAPRRPGSPRESFYDDSVRRLNVVLDARRDRLDASADSDLPLVIAALILVGSIVILGYVTLVGSRAPRSISSAPARSPLSSGSRSSSCCSCSSRSRVASPSTGALQRKAHSRQLLEGSK